MSFNGIYLASSYLLILLGLAGLLLTRELEEIASVGIFVPVCIEG